MISYFGQHPTTIMLKSSNDFNGGAQTSDPVISSGLYEFPTQLGGGLYDYHDEPIDIKGITYSGDGTLSIVKVMGAEQVEVTIDTITGAGKWHMENLSLTPGEFIRFRSSGSNATALDPAIVTIEASLTTCMWAT